jgi:hypothetical protein
MADSTDSLNRLVDELSVTPAAIEQVAEEAQRNGWELVTDLAEVRRSFGQTDDDDRIDWLGLRSEAVAELSEALSEQTGDYTGFSRISGVDGAQLSALATTCARARNVPTELVEQVEPDLMIILGASRLAPATADKWAAVAALAHQLKAAYLAGFVPVGCASAWPNLRLVVTYFR